MTNGEKYKTAQERAEAFGKYCDERVCVNSSCRFVMYKAHNRGSSACFAYWLDLEDSDAKGDK